MGQHGARMVRIHLETVGGGEVSGGFHVGAVEPLVVEHLERGLVALQCDELAIAGLERGRLAGALRELEIGRATSELQSHVNLVCRLLLEKIEEGVQQQVQLPASSDE